MNFETVGIVVGLFGELIGALLEGLFWLMGVYLIFVVFAGIVIRLSTTRRWIWLSGDHKLEWFCRVFFWWLIVLRDNVEFQDVPDEVIIKCDNRRW